MQRFQTGRLIAIVTLTQLLAILLAESTLPIHVQLDGHHKAAVVQLIEALGFRLCLGIEQQPLVGDTAQYEGYAVAPGSTHHNYRFGGHYAVTGHIGFNDGAKGEANAFLFLLIDAQFAIGLDYIRSLGVLQKLPDITLRILTRIACLHSQTIWPIALRRYGPR